MKSFLVIGMGLFGQNLARKLSELGSDVMIMDRDPEIIDKLAPHFTDACIGDSTNEAVLRSIGVNSFHTCFVTTGENFQSSLETTSLLKDLGAKYVISKATTEIHAKFLLRNGADEIICPEKESAIKLAIRSSAKHIYDYIDITPDFSVYEVPFPESWIGKTIASIDVRRKHSINIIAINHDEQIIQMPGPDYVFQPGEHLIVTGKAADIQKFTSRL